MKCERCKKRPMLLKVNKRNLCLECYQDYLKDVGEMLRKFKATREAAR